MSCVSRSPSTKCSPGKKKQTAATFTLNSPDSLPALHALAAAEEGQDETLAAEFIREVGLKCISFNGIPRTINCLNAFHASLPRHVQSSLCTTASRTPTAQTLDDVAARGRRLWKSIYAPLERKLLDKLAQAHPDLPVIILNSHYGPLLADPPATARGGLATTGRVITSVVAIACLRAQTGVGPQVLSHVFGLKKAFEDGSSRAEGEDDVAWLATDDGLAWILETVDDIVRALGGSNFAAGRESKL